MWPTHQPPASSSRQEKNASGGLTFPPVDPEFSSESSPDPEVEALFNDTADASFAKDGASSSTTRKRTRQTATLDNASIAGGKDGNKRHRGRKSSPGSSRAHAHSAVVVNDGDEEVSSMSSDPEGPAPKKDNSSSRGGKAAATGNTGMGKEGGGGSNPSGPKRTGNGKNSNNATKAKGGMDTNGGKNSNGGNMGRGGGNGPEDPNATTAGQKPDPTPMYADYEIRMVDGWTLNDGTFEPQPMVKRRKIDTPFPQLVNHTYRAMSGLSRLQLAHNMTTGTEALDVANEHLWKSLHGDVKRNVWVGTPNGPDLWSGDEDAAKKAYAKIGQDEYKNKATGEYLFYSQIKSCPWVIWPLWVEDEFGKDFVTVLLYSKQGQVLKDQPVYDQLVRYTVIDPRRAGTATKIAGAAKDDPLKYDFPHERTARLDAALRRFLTHAGYDLSHVPLRQKANGTPMGPMTVTHCSPMPNNECSSGERCFATVKELLERITQWHLQEHQRPEEVFRPLRPWINPYQYRVEMAGICAWVLMATLDFEARIAVEIIPPSDIEVMSDGKRRLIEPYDLAGPFEYPPLAPRDWLLAATPAPPMTSGGGGKA